MSILHALLPAALLFCLAAEAQNQPSAGAQSGQITTTGGRTYHQASVVDVLPDGIVVSYQPAMGGIGLATIKFAKLPASVQKRYGYDPGKASTYEKQQAEASEKWRARTVSEDAAFQRYRDFAELNRALGGDVLNSYSVSLDSHGKVTAHGFTGNVRPPRWYLGPAWPAFPGNFRQPDQTYPLRRPMKDKPASAQR